MKNKFCNMKNKLYFCNRKYLQYLRLSNKHRAMYLRQLFYYNYVLKGLLKRVQILCGLNSGAANSTVLSGFLFTLNTFH